jgi:hypothetical protein
MIEKNKPIKQGDIRDMFLVEKVASFTKIVENCIKKCNKILKATKA